MLMKILEDLEQLKQLCGPEIVEAKTEDTRAKLEALISEKTLSPSMKQDLAGTFADDLARIHPNIESAQIKKQVQDIAAKYIKMVNPQPQQAHQQASSSSSSSASAMPVEPRTMPKRGQHSGHVGTRGSVIGSTASMASVSRSVFFQSQSNNIHPAAALEKAIERVCRTGDARKKIVLTIGKELQRFKNDTSRYKEVISHLEKLLVFLLVRTDLPLAVIHNSLANTELAKKHQRFHDLSGYIQTKIETVQPEACFPLDKTNYTLIQEILPAMVTASKDTSVVSLIKNARAFAPLPDNKEQIAPAASM